MCNEQICSYCGNLGTLADYFFSLLIMCETLRLHLKKLLGTYKLRAALT